MKKVGVRQRKRIKGFEKNKAFIKKLLKMKGCPAFLKDIFRDELKSLASYIKMERQEIEEYERRQRAK